MEGDPLVAAWRELLAGSGKGWALFENGTCVLLDGPAADPSGAATDLLRQHGPVRPGTESGDFSVLTLEGGRGRVVTCHHDAILTLVGPDEAGPEAEDVAVGLLGRSKRAADAEGLRVRHVEPPGPA